MREIGRSEGKKRVGWRKGGNMKEQEKESDSKCVSEIWKKGSIELKKGKEA